MPLGQRPGEFMLAWTKDIKLYWLNKTMDPSWEDQIKRQKLNAQGYRKRMVEDVCDEAPFSHLARYLLEEHAFGGLSANQVQKLAMMAKEDGVKHTSIDKLASLGASDKYPGNCHRDLHSYMSKYLHPTGQPQVDCVKIPLKIRKGEKAGIHLIPYY